MAEFVADDFEFIAKRQREIQAEIARETGCDIKPVEQVTTPKAPEETTGVSGLLGGFITPAGDAYG